MSTQAFQLDPSLAGLSPSLLKKRYDQLTPEERRALGFTRLATDQEAAAADSSQPQGAPADFGGPVLPNPNGIRVSDDTDPGGEPTRLPNGVSLQKQNFSGATPGDVSNPPQAQLAAPAMQTVGAQNSPAPLFDMSKAKPVAQPLFDMSQAKPLDSSAEPSGFWDTLQREGKALTGSIAGMPAAVYHAFSEPATQEEKDRFGGEDEVAGAKRIGLGIHRLTTAPVESAVNWYTDVAKGKVPNAYENALSVLPEALGSASGSVIAGKLTEGAVNGAVKAPGVVKAAAESPAGEAAIAATKAAAKELPSAAVKRIPYVGKVASDVYKAASKAASEANAAAKTNAAVTPGEAEEFEGVTSPQTEHASSMEPEAEPPATETAAPESPAATLTKKATPAEIEKALNDALGGKPLQKGVSLKNQNQTSSAAPASNLPEGFTPVKSSALQGYKYDPATREFESITTGGQHYIHGDVSPEDAQAFEAADSKGKAWQQIRQNPLVAKVVNGNRVATRPGAVSATPEGETTPLSQKLANLKEIMNASPAKAVATPAPKANAAAPPASVPAASEDLTSVMQQSLDQAPGKGGVFTSAAPKDLLDRWGVDPDSFTAGREQTRGMSPQESAASIKKLTAAYKKGQTVEPVLETRDANNNIIDVDGRGRAIAAHKAGIDRIPVIVRRMQ
jgi:hypothetical protein